MNTDPLAINVLCFGDSNTWGQKPDRSGRYPADVRWTGQLQNLLGDDYYIVEEGLGSRTTDLDYDEKPGRNGKAYLVPCLASHTPVDIVIVMLGTNDVKMIYKRTAREIADALEGLVADIRQYGLDSSDEPARIILVSPIAINTQAPRFAEFYTDIYDDRAAEESRNLSAAIAELAQRAECEFVDAATVAQAGEDGIHINAESQAPLAGLLKPVVEKLVA